MNYIDRMRVKNLRRKKHGSFGMYRQGCRCAACKKKNAKACRDNADLVRMLRVFREAGKAREYSGKAVNA